MSNNEQDLLVQEMGQLVYNSKVCKSPPSHNCHFSSRRSHEDPQIVQQVFEAVTPPSRIKGVKFSGIQFKHPKSLILAWVMFKFVALHSGPCSFQAVRLSGVEV